MGDRLRSGIHGDRARKKHYENQIEHLFTKALCFILTFLQGYEGSLLKVTGKNGKTTSVSTSPPYSLQSHAPPYMW
jgi:hypothetical protein